jgi:hypothetical protein
MLKISKIEKIIKKYKHCYNLIKLCSNRNIHIYEVYFLDFFEYIKLIKKLDMDVINNKEEIVNLFSIFKQNFNVKCFDKFFICLDKRFNKERIKENLKLILKEKGINIDFE